MSSVETEAPLNNRGVQCVIESIGFDALIETDFPELEWNIEHIIPAGTFLLSGKPKKGKSYLSYMIAISVASGREIFGRKTSGGRVLYMGLEDSQRRMKSRGLQCAESLGVPVKEFSGNLDIAITCSTIDTGLLDELENYMTRHPSTGMIIVDMLKKVTSHKATGKNLYMEQAVVGEGLTKFCHEYPGLTILVITHSRKETSEDDPFDDVSGTTGLVGSYDQIGVIVENTDGSRTLHTTGRDIEGSSIPLMMKPGGMYTLKMPTEDEAATHGMSTSREKVFHAVPNGQEYSRAEIIRGCKLSGASTDKQLKKLLENGLIEKSDYGKYIKTGKRFFDEPIRD